MDFKTKGFEESYQQHVASLSNWRDWCLAEHSVTFATLQKRILRESKYVCFVLLPSDGFTEFLLSFKGYRYFGGQATEYGFTASI